ncbi:MAG: hypothetical protein ACRYGR_01575 [Janthinobacterium lividum]
MSTVASRVTRYRINNDGQSQEITDDVRDLTIIRRDTDNNGRERSDIKTTVIERMSTPRGYDIDRAYDYATSTKPAGYELDRIVRTVEYMGGPIIYRQEPIIIERPVYIRGPDPRYDAYYDREHVGARIRRDVDDYVHEKADKVMSKVDGVLVPEQEYRRERERERDVAPNDSASQHGRDYEDESYYRRERIVETDDRGESPHHKRHLAEGALAGLGVAELIRHHKKRQGEDTGHRGRRAIGSAALGAVGAEVISRARSRARSMRRSRSRSSDGGRVEKRGRDRSRSKSRVRQIATVAGVAGVAALAGFALRNRNNNRKEAILVERQSRSRHRRGSADSFDEVRARSEDPPAEKNHGNRIAQAGLASAAAAGLWQRLRSRSRAKKGIKERSRSRLRTGVPIAAAGLGGAAVAGLYQRQMAKKQAKRQQEEADAMALDDNRERSMSRDRSRSMSYSDDHGYRRSSPDGALIEYGGDPIYSDRRAEYHQHHHRRRRGSSSSEDSPDRRRGSSDNRSRSRSRTRGLAEAAAAAGVAGVAAHQYTKNKERKRAERERRRKSCRPIEHAL